MAHTGPIENPAVLIKPSEKLRAFIEAAKHEDMLVDSEKREKYLLDEADLAYIKSLKLGVDEPESREDGLAKPSDGDLLSLKQLRQVYEYLQKHNKRAEGAKVYLHELFEGSEIVLPANAVVPRSKELEERCRRLKAQQQNLEYNAMTKNVDNVRKRYPEDTIAYQMKQMNRHLIAVFQFILSVLAGFAFGFIGVELIVGSLDFGFRLLLGIICSLVIALAELYFLAKKLNEDLQFEREANRLKKEN